MLWIGIDSTFHFNADADPHPDPDPDPTLLLMGHLNWNFFTAMPQYFDLSHRCHTKVSQFSVFWTASSNFL